MGSQLAGIKDPRRALETAVRSHLYLSEVLQPWFFFSYMETRFFHTEEGERAIAGELQTEGIFAGILENGATCGDFAVKDPLMVAAAIKALLQDWYLKRWKYRRRRISVEAYADFVISMIGTYVQCKEGEQMMASLDQPNDVRRGEALDAETVAAYLMENLPGLKGPVTVRQFHSGYSNLTYLLTIGKAELILRRPPFGKKAKSAHDMKREYRILKRFETLLPVRAETACLLR